MWMWTDQLCIQAFSYFVIPFIPFYHSLYDNRPSVPRSLNSAERFQASWKQCLTVSENSVSVLKDALRGVLYLECKYLVVWLSVSFVMPVWDVVWQWFLSIKTHFINDVLGQLSNLVLNPI